MQKEIILVKNGEFIKNNPEDLANLLGLWSNGNELASITNQETIDLLANNPNIQDLIFNTTDDFFNESIRYYSNKIESSGSDKDELNVELSSFFSNYNDLQSLYPEQFKDALLTKFNLNEDETKLFIESCTNSQNQPINFIFFDELKKVNRTNTDRFEFEQEFMNWFSDWDTKKSLDRGSNKKFSQKYEVFFRYVEEVLLKNENTEILADLKNYVISGHFYNDLLSPNPKNETPELWNLRKSFIEFVGGKTSDANEHIFKNLMLERQRSTLSYVNARTTETNNLSTTKVDIQNTETFRDKNNETRRFADGATSTMPKGYLDRARFDVDNPSSIYIDDVKSSNEYSERDVKTINKNFLSAVILANDLEVNLSIVSPSHCPNTYSTSRSFIEFGDNVTDEEIGAINELYLINAISAAKNLFDLNSEPVASNLKVSKTNIGAQSNNYVSIKDYDIPGKLENVLSFLEKNIQYNNQTRWEPIFSFFLDTLSTTQFTYFSDEKNEYKKLFSDQNINRINELLDNSQWYTDIKKEQIIESLEIDADSRIMKNEERSKRARSPRNTTLVKQEANKLEKIYEEFELVKNKQTVLSDNELDGLKKLTLDYASTLWYRSYKGETNERNEQTLIRYLRAKNEGKDTSFHELLWDKSSAYRSNFRNRIAENSKNWGDMDKINYYFYTNQFNKIEDIVVKISDNYKNGILPENYGKAQNNFMLENSYQLTSDFMKELSNFAMLITNGRESNLEKVSQLRQESLDKLNAFVVTDGNIEKKEELISKLKEDVLKRPKP